MSVKLISTIAELRQHLKETKAEGAIVGLVPTMGALHAGHTRLIVQAVQECGHVVVTLFVNPIQFSQQGDFQRYPRTIDHDVEVCETTMGRMCCLPLRSKRCTRASSALLSR